MGKRFKALIEEKGKDDFFKILSNHPEGMELKIKNVSYPRKSHYTDADTGKYKSLIVITFSYTLDDTIYETQIRYNVGVVGEDNSIKLKNTTFIFKLLEFFAYQEFKGAILVETTPEDIINTLKGQEFIGRLDDYYNNYYVNPIEKKYEVE